MSIFKKWFGPKKTTQTQTSSNTHDQFVTDHAKGISGRASALGKQGYTPYGGDRTATYDGRTHSGLHSKAFGMAGDTTNPFRSKLGEMDYTPASREHLEGRAFDVGDASGWINKFTEAANPALMEIDDTLKSSLNNARASAGSAFGGSRAFLQDSAIAGEAARAKGGVLSDAITRGINFGSQQHQQNIANRHAAEGALRSSASALGGLAQVDQGIENAQIANLLNAGNTEVGLDQAALDRDYADHMVNTEMPYNLLQKEASILGSLPKNTYGSTTATGMKKNPLLGNLLGLAGTAAGAFLGGGGGTMMGAQLFPKGASALAAINGASSAGGG